MVPLLLAGSAAAKSEITKDIVASVTKWVSNLFGGLGQGGGAGGLNKRDEARIARATSYALGVKAGSVDAARYMLGTQATRGAASEKEMYDKLVTQLAGDTLEQARKLGGLQDTDSGKAGLQILLLLRIGLDVPRAGCFTSSGDPDPACAGIVTQLVALARSPATTTAPAAGGAPNAPGTPAPGAPAPAPKTAGPSGTLGVLLLLGLLGAVVVGVRRAK